MWPLTEIAKDHSAVIFNGNGYCEEWHKEAAKRGLPNLKTTVEAIPMIVRKDSIDLFDIGGRRVGRPPRRSARPPRSYRWCFRDRGG